MLLKKGEELNEFVVRGNRPAACGNIHKMHAKSFDPLAFVFHRALVLSANVNYGRDSKFLELLKAFLVWLRAAVEKIIEFANVRRAGKLHSFAENRRLSGVRFRDGGFRSGMRGMSTSIGEHQPKHRYLQMRAKESHTTRIVNHFDARSKRRQERPGHFYKVSIICPPPRLGLWNE